MDIIYIISTWIMHAHYTDFNFMHREQFGHRLVSMEWWQKTDMTRKQELYLPHCELKSSDQCNPGPIDPAWSNRGWICCNTSSAPERRVRKNEVLLTLHISSYHFISWKKTNHSQKCILLRFLASKKHQILDSAVKDCHHPSSSQQVSRLSPLRSLGTQSRP